jgi:hypothetical protein
VTDLADQLRELAEGAAREMRPPGADLARRQGRRRRRRLAAGVALAMVLAVGVVHQGRLADWSAPAPPAGPGDSDEVLWPDPSSLRLPGVAEVGHGQLPGGGSWWLQAGRYDRPNPDGKQEFVEHLVVASQGQPKASAMFTFEAPVRLAADTSMTYNENLELPRRPVFGAVTPRAARVVVIPRQGPAVLAPIQAELLDPGPGLPVRLWVTSLPAGGTPAQTVHQVRSYDPDGRELCRLDPDILTPRCID